MKTKLSLLVLILLLVFNLCQADVTTTTTKAGPYSCNGSTTEFTFGFPIFNTSDIVVVHRTTSTGVGVSLTETTHYAVTATNNDFSSGGTVTTVATYASGVTLTLYANIPDTQNTDMEDSGVLRVEDLEDQIDKLTLLVQQLQEQIDRCIKIPVTESTTVDAVNSVDRASSYLAWGSDGSLTSTAGTSSDVTASTFMATVLDDTTDSAALTTLSGIFTENVQHHGATGNGTTDDTTAFQAAMTAGIAGGRIVYVPKGTYNCSTLWTTGYSVTSPLYIVGESRDESIIQGPDNTVDFISTTANVFIKDVTLTRWDQVVLVGTLTAAIEMRFDNVKNTNSDAFVYREDDNAYDIENFSMTNCLIDHSARSGQTTSGVQLEGQLINANISNNVFTDIGGMAVYLGGDFSKGDWNPKQRFVVADNIFKNCISVGSSGDSEEAHAVLAMGRWITITGNSIDTVYSNVDGDNGEGIYVKAAFGIIANNVLYDAGSGEGAIALKGGPRGDEATDGVGYNVLVANNHISWPDDQTLDNATPGIYCAHDGSLITGNYIEYSLFYGIELGLTTIVNVAVTNNTIAFCRGNGAIWAKCSGNNLSINDNRIYDMIGDLATNSTVFGIYVEPLSATLSYVDVCRNTIDIGDECTASTGCGGIYFRDDGYALDYVTCINNTIRVAHATLTEYGIRHAGDQSSTNYIYWGNDVSQVAANAYEDEAVTSYQWKTFGDVVTSQGSYIVDVNNVSADLVTFNTYGINIIDSSGAGITGTLADGTTNGQKVKFVCKVAGNNIDISVSNHVTSNPEVIRLDTALEWVELVWDGTDWVETDGNGQSYP